jgi:hypothetical protein
MPLTARATSWFDADVWSSQSRSDAPCESSGALALLRLNLLFTKPQDSKLTLPVRREPLAAINRNPHGLSAKPFKLRSPLGRFCVTRLRGAASSPPVL